MTEDGEISGAELQELVKRIKLVAREYREKTGRPLGCTGEIAEIEACAAMDWKLAKVREAGFDAIRTNSDGSETRIQIKGRVVLSGSKLSARMGRIGRTKDFDTVALVLLNEYFELTHIFEAERQCVIDALEVPGSRSRNELGALPISKFKSIGQQVWPPI